jgi:hypothetical protein
MIPMTDRLSQDSAFQFTLPDGRLSYGEFVALHYQAQDRVVAWANQTGAPVTWDGLMLEFGRLVEERVRRDLELEKEPKL